jgi:hypothetical protein
MDGRTLMEIMQSPNFSMWAPAEQAFNTAQERSKADLATTLGMEQRNKAMHPLEMRSKEASAKLNESTANLNQYALDTKLPREEALKLNMQKFFKESDEMTQEQTRMKVQRMMQIAQMAKSNGGALPPGIQLSPEEIQQYSPANLDKLIKYGETFFASDPKEIASRQRAAEALKLAQTRTEGQIAVKGTPTPGKGGGGKTTDPGLAKMNLEQQYGYYNNLAVREPDPEKKKQYQAEADRIELMIYRKQIEAAAARRAGDPNLADPRFDIPVNPNPSPTPTPRGNNPVVPPSSGSPAQTKMTLGKLQDVSRCSS